MGETINMITQLEIIKHCENYSVTDLGEIIHYKTETSRPSASLWQDYGEACCMACGKQIDGGYEGIKIIDPLISETKARQRLEKAHIIAKSLGGAYTVDNLVVLCKRCHKLSPDTIHPEIFWVWMYDKITNCFFGVDCRDIDNTFDILVRTNKFDLDINKIGMHGVGDNYENSLMGTLSEYLGGVKKDNPRLFYKVLSDYYEKDKCYFTKMCGLRR